MIKAHALLCRANRKSSAAGEIIALLEDYEVVYGLVNDLIGEGVGLPVSETVRDTVAAEKTLVREGTGNAFEEVNVTQIASKLGIDKTAAIRRVRTSKPFLVNREDHRGRPTRIVVGEALPVDRQILPDPHHILGS